MKPTILIEAVFLAGASILLSGCKPEVRANPADTAPLLARVEKAFDSNYPSVDRPQRFPLVRAGQFNAAPELNTTGLVNPDVARTVPVISLSSGRVIDIRARLGDTVKKGQLLLQIQSSDISQAFNDWRQAVADEKLARSQYERAKILFDKGAVAQKDLEVAEDADVKAKVLVETTRERLRVLGADTSKPSAIVDIFAPVSGVITEQNVTRSAGVKTLDNSPNLFTIADLSSVWILCDVYENDLPFVRLGEYADIHINAYPKMVLKGRVGNIGPVMDPNIRTAKVRLEVPNPGVLRIGMFVTATFHAMNKETRASVPASAVLHLHDRDWVYVPAGNNRFRRAEVAAGRMLDSNQQEIVSGISPGQEVVANALVLQNTVEQ